MQGRREGERDENKERNKMRGRMFYKRRSCGREKWKAVKKMERSEARGRGIKERRRQKEGIGGGGE